MALSQAQIDAITETLGAYESSVTELNEARADVWAVLRVHGSLSAADAMQVVNDAKARGLTAASALVTLLS